MWPDYETLLYEEKDGVAWVTMNRPERLNAFNSLMQRELHDCWRTLRRRDEVRCVVLTGAGEKAFCTGIDRMEQMGGEHDESTDPEIVGSGSTPFMFNDPGDNIGPKSSDLWKPVIAAVNGMACGGAFYMLGEVEFIIAAEHATFFDPHVTYGLVAALEPIALTYRMPFADVMRMALLGGHERITADRALTIGLVTEVVERDSLEGRAHEIARVIAGQPAAAVQGTVKALWQSLDVTRSQALATALMYTQVGNPLGTADLDRAAAKPADVWRR